MRVIILSIISWLFLILIAVVVIFSVLALLKITKETIRKLGVSRKDVFIGLIVSTIVMTVLFVSVLKYFVWKSPTDKITDKISESKPLTQLQKEEPVDQIQSQAPIRPKEIIPMETSTEQLESSVSVAPEEAVSRDEKKEPRKKVHKKLPQLQKPSRTLFTVQVGAFNDLSNANSLKARFHKKGYSAFITYSTSKKEGRLYKVCISKFAEREKANTLSEKIRNSEGLQTFVTSIQP